VLARHSERVRPTGRIVRFEDTAVSFRHGHLKKLSDLRREREQIGEAIIALERLVQGYGKRRGLSLNRSGVGHEARNLRAATRSLAGTTGSLAAVVGRDQMDFVCSSNW
jgi:hypothetical protein